MFLQCYLQGYLANHCDAWLELILGDRLAVSQGSSSRERRRRANMIYKFEAGFGRTHQLRLHMMAIGHAILGDALYATPEEIAKAPRLLLHARELQLKHPVTAKWMAFESSVPF